MRNNRRSVGSIARSVFLDSPVSRFGCRVATTLGLLWAVPLSVGRIERHGRLIVCRGLPKWAFRRGGVCVGRVFITRNALSEAVLRHESVHLRQWERYGLLFPLLYALAGSDPHTNRFEIEAGLEDGGYTRRLGGPGTPKPRRS